MIQIRDFKCTYGNSVGISDEVTKTIPYSFPDAYCREESLAALSKAVKEHDSAQYCLLPFCRTTEAEALGADIRLGDAKTGPRAGEYICTSLQEILDLPPLDLNTPRLAETLKALHRLKEDGEVVAYELTGPFTILNALIDVKYVFRAYRKDYELLIQVLKRLQDDLITLCRAVQDYGADIIILSDSSGTPGILGPKMSERIIEDFTAGLVASVKDAISDDCILLLCPKLVYGLVDTGHASIQMHTIDTLDFTSALLAMRGTAKIAGQTCIKNINVQLKTPEFQEIVLEK